MFAFVKAKDMIYRLDILYSLDLALAQAQKWHFCQKLTKM
jgi:hypothetical protein